MITVDSPDNSRFKVDSPSGGLHFVVEVTFLVSLSLQAMAIDPVPHWLCAAVRQLQAKVRRLEEVQKALEVPQIESVNNLLLCSEVAETATRQCSEGVEAATVVEVHKTAEVPPFEDHHLLCSEGVEAETKEEVQKTVKVPQFESVDNHLLYSEGVETVTLAATSKNEEEDTKTMLKSMMGMVSGLDSKMEAVTRAQERAEEAVSIAKQVETQMIEMYEMIEPFLREPPCISNTGIDETHKEKLEVGDQETTERHLHVDQRSNGHSPQEREVDEDMKTMMKWVMGMMSGLDSKMECVARAQERAEEAVFIAEQTEAKLIEVLSTWFSRE